MPSMWEDYNTDGMRISTTAASISFLHRLPHANPTTPPAASAAFFMLLWAKKGMIEIVRKLGDY